MTGSTSPERTEDTEGPSVIVADDPTRGAPGAVVAPLRASAPRARRVPVGIIGWLASAQVTKRV